MSCTKCLWIIAVFGSAISGVQASTIQIDDLSDIPALIVDGVTITGNGGKISGYSNTFDPNTLTEKLQFTFTSAVASGVNVMQYTRMNCTGCAEESLTGGPSDIFLIQETAGSFNDTVTFLSSDTASVLAPPTGFTASARDPLEENGQYQIVFRTMSGATVVDEYQARSDVPEPATLALFAIGLGSLRLFRHRKAG
jgi:hypothetical protein